MDSVGEGGGKGEREVGREVGGGERGEREVGGEVGGERKKEDKGKEVIRTV